jgi:hypothetical protein
MVYLVMEDIEIRPEPDYFNREKLITVPGHQPTQQGKSIKKIGKENLWLPAVWIFQVKLHGMCDD